MQPIQLIVGLGNPGPKYQDTRHNAGFWYLNQLAKQLETGFKSDPKCFAETAKAQTPNGPLWLAKPTTFMNLSGKAIQALLRFYKIPINALLIVHDELDLPPGCLRLKTDGGTGGHNGLKSTIQSLGQQKHFHRARIGIGRPQHAHKVEHYVLSCALADEQAAILHSIEQLLTHTQTLMEGNIQKLMRHLHHRSPSNNAQQET